MSKKKTPPLLLFYLGHICKTTNPHTMIMTWQNEQGNEHEVFIGVSSPIILPVG